MLAGSTNIKRGQISYIGVDGLSDLKERAHILITIRSFELVVVLLSMHMSATSTMLVYELTIGTPVAVAGPPSSFFIATVYRLELPSYKLDSEQDTPQKHHCLIRTIVSGEVFGRSFEFD